MITVTIEEIPYNIPSNWNDISFGRYLAIVNKSMGEIDPIGYLSTVTDIPAHVIENTPAIIVEQLYSVVSFIHEDGLQVYNVYPAELEQIEIKEKPYRHFIATSNAVTVHWRELYGDKLELSEAEVNNVYLHAAVTAVKEYMGLDILTMPIPSSYGLAVFFCSLFRNLTTNTAS